MENRGIIWRRFYKIREKKGIIYWKECVIYWIIANLSVFIYYYYYCAIVGFIGQAVRLFVFFTIFKKFFC